MLLPVGRSWTFAGLVSGDLFTAPTVGLLLVGVWLSSVGSMGAWLVAVWAGGA